MTEKNRHHPLRSFCAATHENVGENRLRHRRNERLLCSDEFQTGVLITVRKRRGEGVERASDDGGLSSCSHK